LENLSDITHRPFRLWEFLGENAIKAVAFAGLATIMLIMAFVFREAYPIFKQSSGAAIDSSAYQAFETYGEQPTDSSTSASTSASSRLLETAGRGGKVSAANLLGTVWQPVSAEPKYGLWPLVAGSFKVTLIALLIAGPIGILAALFAAAFAPRWIQEIFKPAVEILAGFPSVVVGFFALVVLATFLQTLFGYRFRLNALVGGVALSLAVIPIIFTVTEDALNAVPKSLTEASLALGASKWQTVLFVVLQAATPGVLAAMILGFGRAFGETMIVLMATGNAALLSPNPVEPVRTMSATIGAEMAEVVFGDTHYSVLFFIGAILFAFTFILNAVAEFYVRQKLMKRFKGS